MVMESRRGRESSVYVVCMGLGSGRSDGGDEVGRESGPAVFGGCGRVLERGNGCGGLCVCGLWSGNVNGFCVCLLSGLFDRDVYPVNRPGVCPLTGPCACPSSGLSVCLLICFCFYACLLTSPCGRDPWTAPSAYLSSAPFFCPVSDLDVGLLSGRAVAGKA